MKTDQNLNIFKPSEQDSVVNEEKERIFSQRVNEEKEKLLFELTNLNNELEEKNKEFIIIEIKNELLKKMISEEKEKYKKYADYDFS